MAVGHASTRARTPGTPNPVKPLGQAQQTARMRGRPRGRTACMTQGLQTGLTQAAMRHMRMPCFPAPLEKSTHVKSGWSVGRLVCAFLLTPYLLQAPQVLPPYNPRIHRPAAAPSQAPTPWALHGLAPSRCKRMQAVGPLISLYCAIPPSSSTVLPEPPPPLPRRKHASTLFAHTYSHKHTRRTTIHTQLTYAGYAASFTAKGYLTPGRKGPHAPCRRQALKPPSQGVSALQGAGAGGVLPGWVERP